MQEYFSSRMHNFLVKKHKNLFKMMLFYHR